MAQQRRNRKQESTANLWGLDEQLVRRLKDQLGWADLKVLSELSLQDLHQTVRLAYLATAPRTPRKAR